MNQDIGHWIIESVKLPEQTPYGFIYEITNLLHHKKYIGKKQCISIRKRPPLKGKKNKRHFTVETDWKIYTGSNNELNSDIEKYGKNNFRFEIIKWCESKSELAYWEAKIQFERDVLLREDYYNGIINLRVSKLKNK